MLQNDDVILGDNNDFNLEEASNVNDEISLPDNDPIVTHDASNISQQEEDDYKYALMLSQQMEQNLDESRASIKSQEDEDLRLAQQLQDEEDQQARSIRERIGIEERFTDYQGTSLRP